MLERLGSRKHPWRQEKYKIKYQNTTKTQKSNKSRPPARRAGRQKFSVKNCDWLKTSPLGVLIEMLLPLKMIPPNLAHFLVNFFSNFLSDLPDRLDRFKKMKQTIFKFQSVTFLMGRNSCFFFLHTFRFVASLSKQTFFPSMLSWYETPTH